MKAFKFYTVSLKKIRTLAILCLGIKSVCLYGSGYDADEEYVKHQEVNERFFRRCTVHPEARKKIDQFKGENEAKKSYTRIDLDGFSSRTRILMMRELMFSCKGNATDIPFSLHGKKVLLDFHPNLRQPGDGVIDAIGTYGDVVKVLDCYKPEFQSKVAKKLKEVRRVKTGHTKFALDYHDQMPKCILGGVCPEDLGTLKKEEKIDLEILNVLLDFEVARRLIGDKTKEENTYDRQKIIRKRDKAKKKFEELLKKQAANELKDDAEEKLMAAEKRIKELEDRLKKRDQLIALSVDGFEILSSGIDDRKIRYIHSDRTSLDTVPVASGVIGLLKCASKDLPLQEFFTTTRTEVGGYSAGDLSVFEGSPDPKGGEPSRKRAAKKIIKLQAGGETAISQSKEDIHQLYVEYFGGASESDGENYGS